MLTTIKKNRTLQTCLILLLFLAVSIGILYFAQLRNDRIWGFWGGSDSRFHLMRIESLANSIKLGNYFPVIASSFLNGTGYIVNIFYPIISLYPAALLRVIGFSPTTAMIFTFVSFNFATFCSAYWTMLYASKKRSSAILASFVYTLATYRLDDLFFRQDLGELGALIFLPFAFLGIYEIFYHRANTWWPLVVGMTGIIYMHPLTPILVALFIIIVMLLQLRVLIKEPRRVLSLIKAASLTLLLTLAYFLPMFEQILHVPLKLVTNNASLIGNAMPARDFVRYNIKSPIDQPVAGVVIMAGLLIVLINLPRIQSRLIRQWTIIALILSWATSSLFPWQLLQNTPLRTIQYPTRWNLIIIALSAIVIATAPLKFMQNKWSIGIIALLTVGLGLFGTLNLIYHTYPQNYLTYNQYNHMNVNAVGGGQEYLPQNADFMETALLKRKPQSTNKSIKFFNFKQRDEQLTFDYQKNGTGRTTVILPTLYYYGYQITNNGQRLGPQASAKGLVQIHVSRSTGHVHLYYQRTLTQLLSLSVSLVTLLLTIGSIIFRKSRSSHQKS